MLYLILGLPKKWNGEVKMPVFWQKAYDEFRILERARVLDGYEKCILLAFLLGKSNAFS